MKTKLKFIQFVLFFLLLLCACAQQEKPLETNSPPAAAIPPAVSENPPAQEDSETVINPEPMPEPEPDPRSQAVETVLSTMTLEEKVGQMFFVRCPTINAEEKISEYHLGGYLLFLQDFKDLAGNWLTAEAFTNKIAAYQSNSTIPLFIGVDEEGGTVARASRNPNLFPEKFKSPQEVFASGGLEAVERDAVDKYRGLLRYGINVNYAPVADVSTDPADFIHARSFGQDAQATAEFVETVVTAAGNVSVSDGETAYKIGSVLKHFPGYGNNVDTHTGIAIDERTYDQFTAADFLPFQAGIKAGAGSVLVSHNIVKCMDESLPASLSYEVHRVLREDLGFEGVILTDDLAMDAVEAYAKDGSVAVLAALAGNDMIVTTDFQTQIPLVIEAVQAGLIEETIIDSAVRRVLGWKYDLGLIK
ncbi:MAG: beta-hexosaminidase [Oscillospiraceae bacterium]|nr:beta-hexosaminidase [Oscillospiraceae bacterium]